MHTCTYTISTKEPFQKGESSGQAPLHNATKSAELGEVLNYEEVEMQSVSKMMKHGTCQHGEEDETDSGAAKPVSVHNETEEEENVYEF